MKFVLDGSTAPGAPPRRPFRESVIWKLFVTGLLILVLMIPLAMVRSLIGERQARRDEAVRELAATWGTEQTLGGPLLTVPFQVRSKDDKGKETITVTSAHFLPESLRIEGRVVPERRSRGIFEVVLYRADLRVAGTFARPDLSDWRVAPEDVLWQDAFLTVGVPDMRGIRSSVPIRWGNRELQLAPGGAESGVWASGLRVPIPDLAAGQAKDIYAFGFDLGINGSGRLMFLPFGKETTVALTSTWADPSFVGAFLPESRKVNGTGFQSKWSVSYFGRPYPQRWSAEEAQRLAALQVRADETRYTSSGVEYVPATPQSTLADTAFGVELLLPVDVYQKSERSVKYAVLFLLLTFVTFFLYEVFSPFSLHPMQYLLVGSALCLFYLLLLSLAEHAPFGFAYLVASVATVLLIGGYSAAILRGKLRAFLMGVILGLLYGYLYILLQAEDYALLLGAIGLFLILALIMYVTRRIDWSAPRTGKDGAAAQPVEVGA
ncbi:MAG TPA: cell envelope integrity protein CreD [Thermoanaerobaculia bacterium]|nr:cell envelope integrity protein CreD [Thermoanaerobaculia bacterium]